MTESRRWNRRGSEVTPNGYFTVLRSSGWFSTLQLPGGYRYQIGENGKPRKHLKTAPQVEPSAVDATLHLQMVGSTEGRFSWLRLGGIIVAAIALTFFLLFCCGGLDAEFQQLGW